MRKLIRRVFSGLLLLISAGVLIWALWPTQHESVERYLLPDKMQLSPSGQSASPALLQARQVRIDWPGSMRIGDQYEINLIFEPVSPEIIASPPSEGLSDAYTAYNMMADGRFEVAGMRVEPASSIRESLPAKQRVHLKWQVSAQEPGNYTGNVWLSLRFLPLNGGDAVEIPVLIDELKVQATSLLGLSGPNARLAGGIGIIMGLVLSYDMMICLGEGLMKIRHKGLKGY